MPANPRWYPTELPALAQSSSSTSALEASVRTLQNDARIAAIRQALGRRSSGVIAAAQQNTGSIVIGSLMPLVIDPVTRSQPATQTVANVGTAGYIVGSTVSASAQIVDKLTFATDVVASLGARSTQPNQQRGRCNSLTRGFLCGSLAAGAIPFSTGGPPNQIESFDYTTETGVLLPTGLRNNQAVPWHTTGAVTGISSRVSGYFVAAYTLPTGSIFRLGFDSLSVAELPASLPGWLWGTAQGTVSSALFFYSSLDGSYGSNRGGIATFSFASESVSYSAGSASIDVRSRQSLGNGSGLMYIFASSTSSPTQNHRYTVATNSFAQITASGSAVNQAATVGNSTQGYLCGGLSGAYHSYNSFYFVGAGVTTTTKFTYATETLASSTAISVGRSHPTGISNYSSAFFGQ